MGLSCSLYGRCRDRNTGKLTRVSELHRDLVGLGKIQLAFNRLKANEAFYLSQNPKFLDRYQEDLIFTSLEADSEPKLASFYEVAKQIMPEVKMEDIRTLLAKKFKEGVYSYEEAQEKMASFNQNMDGGTLFMGTLIPLNDGKYEFKIVPNSALEQLALIQVMSDRATAEAIIKLLENMGVGIVEGAKSLYNSRNPLVLSNGLLGLITLKGGALSSAYHIKDLASETGHTIVGMLDSNDKFYQRLEKAILQHPEVARELLGELEYAAYENTPKARKEYMGHIVGLYLEQWDNINPNTKLKTIGTIILRMVDWVYSKLHITNRDYYTAKYNAKWAAYNIVKSFMGDNFQGNLQNALSEKEVLQGDMNIIFSDLNTSLLKLHEMLESSKDFGYKVHKNYRDTFHLLMSDVHELNLMKSEAHSEKERQQIEQKAGKTLLKLANFLVNEMLQTKFILDKVRMGIDAEGNPIKNNEAAKFIKYAQQVLDLAEQTQLYTEDTLYLPDEKLRVEISRVFNKLHEICTTHTTIKRTTYGLDYVVKGGYLGYINEVRKQLALRLLTLINGSEFIALGQHVLFESWKIVRNALHTENVRDILEHNIVTSPIARYIDSLADSPDIINLIIYDAVELKKHEANIKTLNMKDRLFDMYKVLRALGVKDTRMFFETDSMGHLTGNLISERNWGEWERLYKKDKKEFEDKWYEGHKNLIPSRIEMYHNTMFLESFGAWREGWHALHSVLKELLDDLGNPLKYEDGKTKKRWMPVISTDPEAASKPIHFDNPNWDKLKQNGPLFTWFNEYMSLKKELDAMLPDGSTNALGVRAPLFMGTTTDRLTNAFKGYGRIKRVGSLSMRRFLLHNISSSPSDTEYGGEHDTYDNEDLYSEGSTIFSRAHANAINSINRVPIFGVKKLPHMDDLSTDLIHSTLAYAAMATSYQCLDEVAEVASQVAETRRIEEKNSSILSQLKRLAFPWGYGRLVDYLNMLVYNNYQDPFIYGDLGRGAAKMGRKVSGIISNFGSVWMLGFNIHSAITNAYTGFNEIWKEANGGEEFNKTDFIWAFFQYIRYWGVGFLLKWCQVAFRDGSIIEAHTKMALFLRMYDIQNANEREFRELHIQTRGWGFMLGWSYTNIAMLPYSITDEWMQSIAFLASARHTKLKNKKDDKEYSLWDAYTVVLEEKEIRTKSGKKKTIKLEPKLVLKGDLDDWLIFNKNQAKLNEAIAAKKARGEELSTAEVNAVYKFLTVPVFDHTTGAPIIDPETGSQLYREEILKDPVTGEDVMIDPYVAFDTILLNRFRVRCRAINNRMHGVYNRGDGGAFLKLAIASMAASMKKYAIGLIDRRFSMTRYDFRTGEMRQGSTVTMMNILADCFTAYSSGLESDIIKYFDSLKMNWPNSWKNIINDAIKIVYGLCKFFYITVGPSYWSFGSGQYLKNRGFSDNQIANTRRFFGDLFRPLWISFLMSFVAPPDEEDDDESLFALVHKFILKGVDAALDSLPVRAMEKVLGGSYLFILLHSIFGDVTVGDEKLLNKEYLDKVVKKSTKNPKGKIFDMRGILYYQLYRGLLELKAYEIGRPLSMFLEYKGLFDAALPSLTAVNDAVMTVKLAFDTVDEEELASMPEKEAKKYHNGREIYTRGDNKYFYKWIKKLSKVTPTRTLETWFNGYSSYETMKYYKEPFDKNKYQEGAFNINRR